jgi:hypothetical protein
VLEPPSRDHGGMDSGATPVPGGLLVRPAASIQAVDAGEPPWNLVAVSVVCPRFEVARARVRVASVAAGGWGVRARRRDAEVGPEGRGEGLQPQDPAASRHARGAGVGARTGARPRTSSVSLVRSSACTHLGSKLLLPAFPLAAPGKI